MDVIFNSDMLYSGSLRIERLPTHIANFLAECEAAGHNILIPKTTLFEYQKNQNTMREKEIEDLKKAAKDLAHYGVGIQEFDADLIVKAIELDDLLRKVGKGKLKFEIVDATIEDYEGALRKACLREPPHPPTGDSDEMRDLVIWETSRRIAKERGGALLLSKDKVHVHFRGDVEAAESGLIRNGDFEQALEILHIDTPASKTILAVVGPLWPDLIQSSALLKAGAHLTSIQGAVFVDQDDGSTEATSNVKFASGDGKDLAAGMMVRFYGSEAMEIRFSSVVEQNGKKYDDFDYISVKPIKVGSDAEDRLKSLLDAIGT